MLDCAWRRGALLARYFHTLRHLKVRQFAGRLSQRTRRPGLPTGSVSERREPVEAPVRWCRRPSSLVSVDEFVFLNRKGRVTCQQDWNHPQQPKLWLYNLHYFDDLNAQGAADRAAWHEDLIDRWVRENPPIGGNGWEPYPTSLRIVNWVKWSLLRGPLDPVATESLALQLRWLRRRIEHHLLGNHLLANAKALVFGGLHFQGPEADEWFRTGLGLLDTQLPEQVLADGGHFELSPMYQLIVLEDLLDLINACRSYSHPIPDFWLSAAQRMLAWMAAMRHPDGEIPFFNDAAAGIAPRPSEIGRYAAALQIAPPEAPPGPLVDLSSSGYARLEAGAAVVIVDIAPVGPDYLPGHAHADTLSFEMSLHERRVFVNCGTSEYGTGPRREWERGTPAHNTVVVDGENSSEVWAGFRVARRARVIGREVGVRQGVLWARGAHDGYRRLPGRPVHRREWELTGTGMQIVDRIDGKGVHNVTARLHVHPDYTVVASSDDMAEIAGGDGSCICRVQFAGGGRLIVESNEYAPEFGRLEPINTLKYTIDEERLPLELKVTITWPGHGCEERQ